jgi:hypothetical protein
LYLYLYHLYLCPYYNYMFYLYMALVKIIYYFEYFLLKYVFPDLFIIWFIVKIIYFHHIDWYFQGVILQLIILLWFLKEIQETNLYHLSHAFSFIRCLNVYNLILNIDFVFYLNIYLSFLVPILFTSVLINIHFNFNISDLIFINLCQF